MRFLELFLLTTVLANADGTAPRANASEYTAHVENDSLTLAASLVPAKEIQRMFGAEVARRYVVLEVAAYPKRAMDIERVDFFLNKQDATVRASRPQDIAWTEKEPVMSSKSPITTIATAGVRLEKESDGYGSRTRVSTMEGVAVTNDPRYGTPPLPPPDRSGIDERIRELALPEGKTAAPVSGYLFFPFPNARLKKGSTVELRWSPPAGDRGLNLTVEQK